MADTKSALDILKEFNDKNKNNASAHLGEFGDYYKNYLNGTNRLDTNSALDKYNSAENNVNNLVNQGYKPSDKVNNAYNNANKWGNQMENMGDFEFKPQYTDKINGFLDQYENNKFSYDINNDPLYQQLAESFQQKGKQAMIDTMGQASAMTGGYGSSYASSVGQQAYQQNLNELNSVVPDLQQMAYSQYSDKQQQTLNLASFYSDMDNGNFDKAISSYQTNMSRYQDLMSYYQSEYQYMDSAERSQYNTMLDAAFKQMNQAYTAYEGAMGQDNYENSMKQSIAQSQADQANKEHSYAWEMALQMANQTNVDREYDFNTNETKRKEEAAAKATAAEAAAAAEKEKIAADAATAEERKHLKNIYSDPLSFESAYAVFGDMKKNGEPREAIEMKIAEWVAAGIIDHEMGLAFVNTATGLKDYHN